MLEVHAILQRQRCNENITKKTGTLSDAYSSLVDINEREKYLSSFKSSEIGRGFDKIMTAIKQFTHEGF